MKLFTKSPSSNNAASKMRKHDLLVIGTMLLAMCIMGWRYLDKEPDLAKVYLAVSIDTLNKCQSFANHNYGLAEAFGGKSKTTLLRECIRESGDPGYNIAAEQFIKAEMAKANQ